MRNVVILGMHRSGTSMVAAALAGAGILAGEASELLEDQEDNPHGFWERRDVVELNDRSLASCGGSWYQPPASIKAAATLATPDIRAILSRMPQDSSWLVKDPRMAITWPLWRDALGDAVVLFVYRDPFAVASSLQRRNGFPLSLGLALWEYYNQQILDALEDRDGLFVSFEAISANPEPTIQSLLGRLADLGVTCDRDIGTSVFDSALGQSGSGDREAVQGLLTSSQRQLADYCEALCSASPPPQRPALDATLWPRLQDLATALAPLARVHETQFELEDSLRLCGERTSERDESLQQLRQLEGEHFDLKDDHQALAEAHQQEVERHEELQRQHNVVLAERASLKEKLETLFIELSSNYGKLLNFEQSLLAGLWRFVGRCYKLARLRPGLRNGYDDVLDDARRHFEQHGLTSPEKPRKPAGKAAMLKDVLSYVARNPAGSARSFSLPRLKRAAAVFMTSSPENLGVWIDSRFPDRGREGVLSAEYELDDSLDELRLVFPVVEKPRVSIVVPVYNEYRVTLRCLKSVLEHGAQSSYEVIIADDCSSDLTASITQRVENIRVVRGEQNRGFLGNCNEAAIAAAGDYILFLNNDTAVTPGWLDALVDVLDRDEHVGITGSKLLFPDGKLQEAGGIVWRDGSGWNYGRMDNPDKPEYNYLKEVDYISGACLMIRADLWRQLGGFDDHFRPAYYEDTDIAFQARAAGFKVVYQPASKVFHFEGVSNGTDLNSGIKKYQVENQAKFRAKWQAQLDAFHFDNAENVFQARDRSRNRRCVLFIDHYVPHHDKDAGSRSTFMYVQLMLELGYKVLFLGANYFPHKPYTETLQQMGVEVLVGESMARHQDRWLQENAPYIDTIYLHRPHVAEQFLPSLDKMTPRPKVVFFGHDLHYLRINREYQLMGGEQLRRDAEKWRQREYAVFDRVDKVYYPSQVEIDEILNHRPDLDLRAIPLYAFEDSDAPAYEFQASRDLLFVGGFNHPPNVDGICWFVEEVLPLITHSVPGVRLHVVGSNPTDTVQDLQSEQVVVYGYLSDEELDALYRRVRVVVVPLRFGAGVKGKVLEAVRKNLPLVTTSVGAEGIPSAESVMTIADTAGDFAATVTRVYEGDSELLSRLEEYPAWLQRNFSKSNAAQIVLQDFGSPERADAAVIASVAAGVEH